MSKPRPSALRLSLLALALVSVTCSDGGETGTGTVSGVVYLSEPVEGATVTVNRWDEGVVGAEICRATSDGAGHYECLSGKYFGPMLVTATGGRTTEQGAALTLPAGSTLRAPLLDLEPQQQRTVHLNPASELIVALGRARFAASQDEGFAASVAHAHELLRTHLDADPVTVAPKAIDAPTAFDEAARVALVLRGLGEYAHTAAVDQAVTVQAVNTRALLDQLVRDAGSAEARLDGNGAEVLSVGPSCSLLAGCSMEQLGCYASCAIYSNSLRSRLGAAILSWLRTPTNATGLDKTDVLTWVTAMKDNLEPQLFGTEGVEPFDEVGPAVAWASPAAAQVFTSGAVAIDVTASDALGVASLEVVAQLGTPLTVTDTDPSPERVVASLPLAGLPEGPLVLLAIARDADGNQTDAPRSIELNLVAGGTISGLAFKARLAGATVTAYRFTSGVRGAAVGSATTGADGAFVNLPITDGTTGALLLETTGGTFAEDSQPATAVTLDVTETLRTVIPSYADGAAISNVVISPLTTLAEAYLSYLTSAAIGGADVAARWTTATSAIEAHVGVANIRDITPSSPAQVDSLAAPDRYGLILIGLSRLAWAASAQGGGDAGAFGPAVNAQTITRTWVRDLSDGCWDGRAGTTALTYGGTAALTEEASRLHLAQAIVAYLGDSTRNQTAFTSAADVLPLLDTIATGGTTTAPGACPGGRVFTTAGDTFDRTGPVVTWTQLPPSPDVRGSFMIAATCADALDPNPVLSIASPAGTVDQDGDITNQNIRASFDTTALPDGPLAVVVDGLDASGNHSDVATSTRSFVVDNTAPLVSVTAPATSGLFLRPPVTLGWSIVEANLAAATATLDGATPVTPGFQVAAEGAHTLAVSATDRAGGTASASRTFTIDSTAPVLTVTAPAHGSFVRGPVVMSFSVTDASPGATASATLDGAAFTSGGSLNTEGAHTLVVNATDAAGNTAATVTRTFTIDNTPPVIAITGVTDGAAYLSGVQIFFTATDANPGTTVTATANGAPHNNGQSLFTAAGYSLVVTATDAAGNSASANRRFLVDSVVPTVTIRSQAPTGSFVKTPLTIIVDGADNLQQSGVAGLAGSLAAPVTLSVVAQSNGSPTIPGGGEVVNGDGSRTRTATFTSVADGPLVATFAMSDRSGNVATPRTVNVTIDNTAPTALLLSSAGFVETNATYWTTIALPTLTGTVTEANAGAIVTLLNGATVVGTGTVTGTGAAAAWTATFSTAVPESSGFDITVRITDAAGNSVSAPAQRIARDITGPRITSVGRAFYNEANDTLTFNGANRPSHAHGGATTLLGGNGSTTPPVTCPSIAKYAYLTAVAPQGDEPVANPLTFDWQVVDEGGATILGGAGVDDTSFQWVATHVGSGVSAGPYGASGAEISTDTYDVATNLRRDGARPVQSLGAIVASVSQAREGRFNITLRALDRLGNATTLYTCMNYQPIGVPLKVSTPVLASGTGVDALTSYQLAAGSSISQFLNATHPGAGLMTVPVMNPTTDPVVLTFAPSSSGRTYSESWSFVRAPSAAAVSASINCGTTDVPSTTGVCNMQLTGAPSPPTETHAGSAFTYTPQLAVRVWGPNGALTATESVAPGCDPVMGGECSRFRVAFPVAAQFTSYNVVVGLRELKDAQFGTSTSGYAEASTTYWSNVGADGPEYRTISYTGLPTLVPFATTGDGIDRACTAMTETPIAGDPGNSDLRCTQTRRFQAIRYLASVGAAFSPVRLDAVSIAGSMTTFEDVAFFDARITSYSWTTPESLP